MHHNEDLVICRRTEGNSLVYWGYTGEVYDFNMAIRYRSVQSAKMVLKVLGNKYFIRSYDSLILHNFTA